MNAPTLPKIAVKPPPEHGRYAVWFDATSKLGLLMLAAGFLAYVFGLLPPHVPVDQLPALWSHPAPMFMARTGSPAGWDWLALVGRGDIFNLLGITVLAGCSMVCVLAVLPLYWRRGDRVYVWICSLQVAVLLLAASGLLTAGH
jgi:hypothetical protein